MKLDISNTILLITAILNISIALYVLLHNPTKRLNRVFCVFVVQIALWNIANFFSLVATDISVIVLSTKLTLFAVLLVPPSMLVLADTLANLNINRSVLFSVFVPGLAMVPFIFTTHNIQGFDGTPAGDNFIPGHLYTVYTVYFLVVVGYSIYRLLKAYRVEEDWLKKYQYKYVLVGLSLVSAIGITTNAILPLLGTAQFNVLGNPSSIVFTLSTAYAITRHRLFDIPSTVNHKIIRAIVLLAAVALAYAIAYVATFVAELTIEYFILISLPLVLLAVSAVQSMHQHFLQDRDIDLALPDSIRYSESTRDTLRTILSEITQHLDENFAVDWVDLYTYDRERSVYQSVLKNQQFVRVHDKGIVSINAHPLPFTNNTTVQQQSDTSMTQSVYKPLMTLLKKLKSDVVIPLYRDEFLYGFVIIRAEKLARQRHIESVIKDSESYSAKYSYYLQHTLWQDGLIAAMQKAE